MQEIVLCIPHDCEFCFFAPFFPSIRNKLKISFLFDSYIKLVLRGFSKTETIEICVLSWLNDILAMWKHECKQIIKFHPSKAPVLVGLYLESFVQMSTRDRKHSDMQIHTEENKTQKTLLSLYFTFIKYRTWFWKYETDFPNYKGVLY